MYLYIKIHIQLHLAIHIVYLYTKRCVQPKQTRDPDGVYNVLQGVIHVLLLHMVIHVYCSYIHGIVLLYTKGVPWAMKVEPSTNLFIYFCGRHPNVWGPNVNSRSGKANQSWAVSTQFVWLELPVLVPISSMFRTGHRIFGKERFRTGG
jgi:hypothetical protein